MNFDNSWMVSYGSKLRKKEESFDIMCFESSKPAVEYHELGSQDSSNVETKGKPSGMHRETVASTKRENPGLLESSSGGSGNNSSNPSSIASEKEVHLYKERNPSRGQNLDHNFWMTDVQKTLRWYSHLQVRMIRHHGESKRKVYTHSFDKKILGRCHTNWEEGHTSSIEKKIGKEFMYED